MVKEYDRETRTELHKVQTKLNIAEAKVETLKDRYLLISLTFGWLVIIMGLTGFLAVTLFEYLPIAKEYNFSKGFGIPQIIVAFFFAALVYMGWLFLHSTHLLNKEWRE